MRTIRKPFTAYLLSFVMLLGACSSDEYAEKPRDEVTGRIAAHITNVEIIRDDYGVPHIYGKTDADTVFGLMYAQAEDDFPRIERNYVWAIGRLAEVEGESALYSDLRARLYMSEAEAKAFYATAPDWLQELCVAWADGLNYYLETHPEVTPKLITSFEPWMTMYFFEGSIGGDIEQVPLAGIKAFYSEEREAPRTEQAALGTGVPSFAKSAVQVSMSEGQRSGTSQEDSEPGGSNGFAIAGSRTKSGNAMLLINPHTSFYFRGEVHAVSEEGLNAYGAVTWGQFFVYQGFNEKNGWMHTSTYADFKDEFVEDVFEQDGKLYYRYGDEERPVEVAAVTLQYKDGDSTAERTFTTYRTHHGPSTHMLGGKWVATKINWDPVNAIRQSYIRTKTASHVEFQEMMDIRTNSSNNTVYADADGTIAYYHGNFMPRRDPAVDYNNPVDGSDPSTDWQGLHEVDETITLVNPSSGWLQNANSTPYTAAGEASPRREDYPAYMAPDKENFRGVNAVRALGDARDLTLDGLIELAYDTYLPGFEALLPNTVAAFDALGGSEEMKVAVDLFRAWNYRVSANSRAMSIAHFYGLELLAHDGAPAGSSRMEKILWMANDAPAETRLVVLQKAIDRMQVDYGTSDIAWGEINRFQRLDGAIKSHFDDDQPSLPVGMASARWGALAAYGSRQFEGTKKLYGYRGNSFVAVVEFGDRVKAKTSLAGGQSGDPASPHFLDQAADYIAGRFKDVPYYREDVEARAAERYRPGERQSDG